MKKITSESLVDSIFYLKWKSDVAVHTDGYQANRVNMWRDFLPPVLHDALLNREAGDRLQISLENGEAVDVFISKDVFSINNSQFNRQFRENALTEPRLGRFYPKGMLNGISGIFKANMQPFRCVGLNNGHLTVDFNHPLAGKELNLSAVIGKVERKNVERGGTSVDWLKDLTNGPGMQARWQTQMTDYFSDDALSRDDNKPDAEFYKTPRLVNHLDDTAREMVRNTYGRFLTDGMQVLDLMSRWESHIPANVKFNPTTPLIFFFVSILQHFMLIPRLIRSHPNLSHPLCNTPNRLLNYPLFLKTLRNISFKQSSHVCSYEVILSPSWLRVAG